MYGTGPRVGIVGAGITGLTLSYHLDERDVDHVVLEADDEPGGIIRSSTVDGKVLEHGPQRTRLTDTVGELVDALDLHDAIVTADPALPMFVYANGSLGTVPFSITKFFTTDLLSWRGKFRVLAEPLTGRGREDEMAADLFKRKFGEEAYRNFIGPLFGGIYGSDPAEMPAGYAPSPILKLERRSGSLLRPALETALENERNPPLNFEAGLQQLPRAIAREVEAYVHYERPAESVQRTAEGYAITTDEGDELVDRVVLTTPADVSADLLTDVAPDAADRLDRLNYNPLALVHLYAETDHEGFGYQVRRDEGLHTLGVSWNATLFDRDGVYTAFLGGMDEPELLEADDDELGRIATEEFEAVMGDPAEVINITRLHRGFPAWDRSWEVTDDLEFPDGIHLATNYTARMGIPSRLREGKELAETFAEEREERTEAAPTA
ncbi:MAG: oxygen-dependent protoporphyrinogen oxidase [Halobacteriales archaeon]|jgi:oxygen-dependent protoporphyrinogen oxidase